MPHLATNLLWLSRGQLSSLAPWDSVSRFRPDKTCSHLLYAAQIGLPQIAGAEDSDDTAPLDTLVDLVLALR